ARAPFGPPTDALVPSDFYPVLEYVAQQAFILRGHANLCSQYDETLSPRPMTLLAQYLANHQLADTEFKAFAVFNAERRATDPAFARSVLLRWQSDVPEATAPIELAAKFQNPNAVAELESERMAKHRAQILNGTTGGQLELLRLYGEVLLRTYRAQRSAVLVPAADDLQAALGRLMELDPPNRRIYQLRLAELAWDRSD